ncbi:MAG: hypothetical protein ACJAUL_003209 [Paraglaciecola sp.]|jgi:hypothetical protein
MGGSGKSPRKDLGFGTFTKALVVSQGDFELLSGGSGIALRRINGG